MADRLIGIEEVMALIGMSRAFVFRAVKAGTFPAPIKLGRASRWPMSSVAQWLSSLTKDDA